MAAPRARTYSITKSDMEASRLVFVYVRDARPKRKVAVPVPDGYTWEEFITQVKQKLKITGVRDVELASTGQRVTSLDELQDIDELCVTEGAQVTASPWANGAVGSPAPGVPALLSGGDASTSEITVQLGERQNSEKAGRLVGGAGLTSAASLQVDADDNKYARRVHPLRLLLQRWLPGMRPPGLPVSVRDVGLASTESEKPGEGALRKRRKGRTAGRSGSTLRSLLLALAVATCILTILWFLLKAPGPAAITT